MTTDTSVMFVMPSLGADMDEGRITEWLVQPGDEVTRGQIVVIVETEKSDIEVEVFEDAVIAELLVAEGEMVPVGTPIARFDAPGSAPAVSEPPSDRAAGPPTAPSEPPAVAGEAHASHVTSPVLRHLADELHVDAERLPGSGPGGRVHRDDIVAAARVDAPCDQAAAQGRRARITPRARRLLHERGLDPAAFGERALLTGDDILAEPAPTVPAEPAAATAPADATPVEKPSRADMMRRRIADLMTKSWTEIPHYHVAKRLDLSAAVERLTAANEDRSVSDRIVPGVLLLCATARAARKVKACNGWWVDDSFVAADDVRMGVVLSLRTGGILVPTIDRADELTPEEMMVRLGELVQRARQGRLRASDMAEGTITVTNLGDRGADSVAGVIHPPQVAILGFGAVHDELWPIDGQPVVVPTVHASLAGDHRATDGLAGSKYLTQIQNLLNGPLLEEL